MQTFLTILCILAALGAVGALVRGIVLFLKTQHDNVASGGAPNAPSAAGLRQNKMMQARILFQALAVIFAILLMLLTRG